MTKRPLRNKNLFLFDLDGVFYKGKESRTKIGGTKAIETLKAKGKDILVLTNNSTDSVETIHSRLAEFKIPVKLEEVLSSSLLTSEYLLKKHGKVSYFLVGEPGLDHEMKKLGHRRTVANRAQFVVVGLDRKVTYDKLDFAARLVREGAGLVATHSSALYMYKTGPAIATGPLVKAIEFASGKKATVIGKPSPLMFRIALKRSKYSKDESVMVGDQLDTDILGASRAGIESVLVTTGVDKDPDGLRVLATIQNVDSIVGLL